MSALVRAKFELTIRDLPIWSPQAHPDPNPVLLRLDPEPVERLGLLVFRRLGVTTTGYHDDDESDRALTVYAPGTWDEQLLMATTPDLSRYN
jgi:hypothetical protein